MKKYFYLILSVLFFLLPISAGAFSLSPARINVTVDAGSTQIVEIKIRNNDKITHFFQPVAMGVEQNEQGGPRYVSGLSEVESWVNFPTQIFSLAPAQEKKINFTIQAPSNFETGSYYLGVGVEQVKKTNENIGLSGRLLSLVNIKIAGEAKEALLLEKWQSANNVWYQPIWRFILRFKNDGNVELPVSAQLNVRNYWGKIIAQQEVSVGNKLIPGTSREVSTQIILPRRLIFWSGIYQAEIVFNYGIVGQQTAATVKFWYIDWRMVGGLGVLLIVGGILKYKFFRKK